MFYVYEWFNVDTQEIFYVGKGTKDRKNSIAKRNKLFKEYYYNHNCDNRIVKHFKLEEEAFKFEHERIIELKSKGQCFCNLDNGGKGGVNFVWTQEMRDYMSEYNPMKSEEQKQRMSKNNPMKNKDISKKVGEKNKRKVVINNVLYNGLVDASKQLKVETNTILNWCKRGYDTNGNPCRYENEPQKQYKLKITNSKPIFIDDIYFESLVQAKEYLEIKDTSPLCRALKNNKPYKGHICKYANQQPS